MSRVWLDSQSSSSLKKRLWAWAAWSSRKPSTSEPERPNIDELKAVPMPDSGWVRPCLSWVKSAAGSPVPTERLATAAPTELTVPSSPQKVPSSPRKTIRPIR